MVLPLHFQNHGGLGQNVVKDLDIALFGRLFQPDRNEDPVQRFAEFPGNFQKPAGGPWPEGASFKDITLFSGLNNTGLCAPANQVFEAVQLFGWIGGTIAVISYRIDEVEAQSAANPPEPDGRGRFFHTTIKIILE